MTRHVATAGVDASHQILTCEAALREADGAVDDPRLGRDRLLVDLPAHNRHTGFDTDRLVSLEIAEADAVGQLRCLADDIDARQTRPVGVETLRGVTRARPPHGEASP